MVEGMKVTMLMTRKKDMVYSTGLMEGNMKEAGKMVNNMELVLTHQQAVKPNKANGKKVKDLIGLQAMQNKCSDYNDQFSILIFYS